MDEAAQKVLRLKWLRDLQILDTEAEREFDEIAELAAAICRMPISLISLTDERRQWFKAAHGTALRETPLDTSFCAHSIQQEDLLVVNDATLDARFAEMSIVQEEPRVRFYAGMPLRMEDGVAVGTLCVLDVMPRTLTADQANALAVLGRQVQARLTIRSQRLVLETNLLQQKELAAELRASESLFRTFMNNSPDICFIKDADGYLLFANEECARQRGMTVDDCLGKTDAELWPEEQARLLRQHDLEVLAGGVRGDYDESLTLKNGGLLHFRSSKFPCEDVLGRKLLAGVAVNVIKEKARDGSGTVSGGGGGGEYQAAVAFSDRSADRIEESPGVYGEVDD